MWWNLVCVASDWCWNITLTTISACCYWCCCCLSFSFSRPSLSLYVCDLFCRYIDDASWLPDTLIFTFFWTIVAHCHETQSKASKNAKTQRKRLKKQNDRKSSNEKLCQSFNQVVHLSGIVHTSAIISKNHTSLTCFNKCINFFFYQRKYHTQAHQRTYSTIKER